MRVFRFFNIIIAAMLILSGFAADVIVLFGIERTNSVINVFTIFPLAHLIFGVMIWREWSRALPAQVADLGSLLATGIILAWPLVMVLFVTFDAVFGYFAYASIANYAVDTFVFFSVIAAAISQATIVLSKNQDVRMFAYVTLLAVLVFLNIFGYTELTKKFWNDPRWYAMLLLFAVIYWPLEVRNNSGR